MLRQPPRFPLPLPRAAQSLLAAALLSISFACGDATSPTEPKSVEVSPPPGSAPVPAPPAPPAPARVLTVERAGGDDQVAVVGRELPVPLAVRVTDGEGLVVPDVAVVFSVTWGDGSLGGQQTRTVITDADGLAATPWVLGPAAQTNTVSAVLAGDARRTIEFRANARPDVATRLVYWGGLRAGLVGTTLTSAPVVAAVDRFGNRVSGIPVTFTAADDGGSLAGGLDTTDAYGVARSVAWTLGTRAGTYSVTASSPGLESFVFTATAYAGPASIMEVVEGDAQEAAVMTVVPVTPVIRILDQYRNPVRGAVVTFTNGGEFTVPVIPQHAPVTDANGVIRVAQWRLGHRPGIYTLTVRSGALSVRLSATAVAGPPARLLVLDGNFQAAPPGATLLAPPAVWVADAYGNRVARAGIPVTFTVREGGGSISGASVATDSQGVARVGSWTLGPAIVVHGSFAPQRTNRLVAESAGLASVELVAFAR